MALDWLPIDANRVIRRTTRRDLPPVLTGPIVPIPTPAPPVDLTWQPQFPAHPQRHRARRFQPIADCPLVDAQRVGVSWLPILPSRPPRRRVRVPTFLVPFDFTRVTVPSITAWQTVGRLLVRHRTRLRQAVASAIDPTVVLNAAPCVELGDETLTNPTLGTETFQNPTLSGEALTTPTLGSEDLC